jgi:hemolysin activation/secretion protein
MRLSPFVNHKKLFEIMDLTTPLWNSPCFPWNSGERRLRKPPGHYRATFLALLACILQSSAMTIPARAQQANQPGFDPRQTEKYFDERQSGPDRPLRPPPRTPTLTRPDVTADSKPLFVLRAVSVSGASALPPGQLASSYRPYLGRMVSQRDLAAIAQAISDSYRAAGFHLSRAIIPPQDIADGRVRIQVIEGSITEVDLRGDGAEQFGVRPIFNTALAEHPSRLATLERQLLLVNNLPGVRITDSSLEEIGGTSGRFRLVIQLKTWHVYAFTGLDNLG